MFVKIIVGTLIFAYFAIAVKLFNQLNRMSKETGADKMINDIKYDILIILLSLFWPVLIFVKPGNNS